MAARGLLGIKMAKLKTLTVGEVIHSLEALAPSGTSEKWDNTGLLLGDPGWGTKGAIISVDLTEASIEAATRKEYRLIVNHHPCIFPKSKGLSKIVPGPKSGMSNLVFEALKRGIAVASYHTNFDQCALEVPQVISQKLGLVAQGRLMDGGEGSLLKLVVFVPTKHLDTVRGALAGAGAGHIGNYDSCMFHTQGEGTFRGLEGSLPAMGKMGVIERVEESRLETIFPRGLKKQILEALRASHPYEEVAFDLYPVEQGPAQKGLIRGLGYGFWGEFSKPLSFAEFTKRVKAVFGVEGLIHTPPSLGSVRSVRRMGFVAGKGASFVDAAIAARCDVFVTGEAGYHVALDGSRKGLSVIELGHRESEIFYLSTMTSWLKRMGIQTQTLNLRTQHLDSG